MRIFSVATLDKISVISFHQYPSGMRVVEWGGVDLYDRQCDAA